MFERFTERARQIVVLAQEEARNSKNPEIAPEHILCGIFREEEGLAARILRENFKLSPDAAQKLITQGDHKTSGQIPFTPAAKKIWELALREALALGHNYIGTEHILLGLAREGVSHSPGVAKVDEFFTTELRSCAGIPDSHNWPEIVKREVEEALRGPSPRKAPEDLTPEENEEVDVRDLVADLLTGIRIWRELKGEEFLDDADEMLCRWVDATNAREYL